MPAWFKPLLARIHPEVLSRNYGCGPVCPTRLEGCHILDLGCGSGRDVYALSQLVGEHGEVVGIDMTEEQFDVAQRHQDFHREAFDHERSNVRFILDKHHAIEAGRVFPVCGNTWRMLAETRFAPDFDLIGNFDRHYGMFEGCVAAAPFGRSGADDSSDCGCC